MRKTPSKMHMHDMVTIDTILFGILGGVGEGLLTTPPRIVNFLKYPGSDKVKENLLAIHVNILLIYYTILIHFNSTVCLSCV